MLAGEMSVFLTDSSVTLVLALIACYVFAANQTGNAFMQTGKSIRLITANPVLGRRGLIAAPQPANCEKPSTTVAT